MKHDSEQHTLEHACECKVRQVQPVGGYTMGYFKLKKPFDNANMITVCTVMPRARVRNGVRSLRARLVAAGGEPRRAVARGAPHRRPCEKNRGSVQGAFPRSSGYFTTLPHNNIPLWRCDMRCSWCDELRRHHSSGTGFQARQATAPRYYCASSMMGTTKQEIDAR